MKIFSVIIFTLVLLMSAGCAEGILAGDATENQDSVSNTDNEPNGNDDSADVGFDATDDQDAIDDEDVTDPDIGANGDDDISDGDTGHNGDEPCDIVTCNDGPCEPETGECVECLEDLDCEDGVCDPSAQECVECTEDSDCADEQTCSDDERVCLPCEVNDDCPGAGKCHQEYPSCVAECCDFIVQNVFEDIPYIHDAIDIAVTSEGNPVILFANRGTDTLFIAERISNNWYTQNVTAFTGFSVNIRLELDGDDNPHVVLRSGNDWRYLWRGPTGWSEEDVWSEGLTQNSTDLAIDDDGNAHIFGLDSGEIRYAKFEGGTWSREGFEVDDELSALWLSAAIKSDGTPLFSVAGRYDPGDDVGIYVVEKSGSGWQFEVPVAASTQIHNMVVGPTDEIMVVHHDPDVPHGGAKITRDGGDGSWQTETVNSVDRASVLYMDIDNRNDPHIVFHVGDGSGLFNTLAYTRFDGDSWETHHVSESLVERAFWQRIAVDDDHIAHMVVYNSTADTIAYVTMEQ